MNMDKRLNQAREYAQLVQKSMRTKAVGTVRVMAEHQIDKICLMLVFKDGHIIREHITSDPLPANKLNGELDVIAHTFDAAIRGEYYEHIVTHAAKEARVADEYKCVDSGMPDTFIIKDSVGRDVALVEAREKFAVVEAHHSYLTEALGKRFEVQVGKDVRRVG